MILGLAFIETLVIFTLVVATEGPQTPRPGKKSISRNTPAGAIEPRFVFSGLIEYGDCLSATTRPARRI
jgi:hypothetical protein